MTYYPYKLKDEDTGYGQHLSWRIKWEEERKKEEELKKEKLKEEQRMIQQKKKQEMEEFLSFYKKHPITDEMIKKLKEVEPSVRKRINPVYIIDTELDLIDLVTSKNDVGQWIHEKGFSKKELGRTTVFEYIRNETPYKEQLYFVPAKNYDTFIERRKLIEEILI